MMWKSRLLLSLILVAAVQVQASLFTKLDVATLVDESDLIFAGTVIGTQSVPVKDGSFAYTYVTFDVEETFKGAVRGRTLTLRTAGGETGRWVYEIAGAPKFAVGDRHVLFVQGNDRFHVPIVGGPQGKLDLVAHPVTQETIVVDHAGQAIDGLRDKNWVRNGLALDAKRQLRKREPIARVVSQEGVRVELDARDVEPQMVEEAAPASQVLKELRTLVKSRASAPTYRRSGIVESASPSNVPAKVSF